MGAMVPFTDSALSMKLWSTDEMKLWSKPNTTISIPGKKIFDHVGYLRPRVHEASPDGGDGPIQRQRKCRNARRPLSLIVSLSMRIECLQYVQ